MDIFALKKFDWFSFLGLFFSYRRVPIAKLVDIPDVSMVVATVAATFMDNNGEQLIRKFRVISISLKEKEGLS